MKISIQRTCSACILATILFSVKPLIADGIPIPDEITLTVINENLSNSQPVQEYEKPESARATLAFQRVDLPAATEEPRPEPTPEPPQVTPPPAQAPASPRKERRPRCVPRRRSR